MQNAIQNVDLEILDSEISGFESAQPEYLTPGKILQPGDVVTGIYIKTEQGNYGPNYYLQTKQGVKVLNGNGSLKSQMETVLPKAGDILKVTYEGSSVLQKGPYKGKNCHNYKVMIKRV